MCPVCFTYRRYFYTLASFSRYVEAVNYRFNTYTSVIDMFLNIIMKKIVFGILLLAFTDLIKRLVWIVTAVNGVPVQYVATVKDNTFFRESF